MAVWDLLVVVGLVHRLLHYNLVEVEVKVMEAMAVYGEAVEVEEDVEVMEVHMVVEAEVELNEIVIIDQMVAMVVLMVAVEVEVVPELILKVDMV